MKPVALLLLAVASCWSQMLDDRNPEMSAPYAPITISRKFVFAMKDSSEPPTFLFAGVSAAFSQQSNTHPSFGQGAEGFGHRYGAALLYQASGNLFAGALLPALLHQDPRYFRKGRGTVMGRALWAATRVVVARDDRDGRWVFNSSEFVGNAMAAGLSNAYYPDDRTFGTTMQRTFSRIGTDVLTNLLKEFLPDAKRKMARRKQSSVAPVN